MLRIAQTFCKDLGLYVIPDGTETLTFCFAAIRRGRLQGRISHVRVLDLRYSAISSSQLLKFTSLPDLEELNMDSCDVGDMALAHLADNCVCPNLKSLDLADNSRLTDAGIAKIAKFRKLARLSLFYCSITDAGLVHLSQLESLEVLNLDSRELTDDGLKALMKLTKLRSLDIFSGRITDTGCGYLSSIKSLGKFGCCDYVSTRYRQLTTNRSAESLELCGGSVRDFGCSQLAKLENLETLVCEIHCEKTS
jgi:hypothetical protein